MSPRVPWRAYNARPGKRNTGLLNRLAATTRALNRGTWTAWLAVAGVLLALVLTAAGMQQFDLWSQLPRKRATETLALLLLLGGIGALLARAMRTRWPIGLVLAFLAVTAVFTGVRGTLAVLLLLASGVAVGTLLLRRWAGAPAAMVLALGLALIGMAVGWLLPLPLHRWWLYLPAALLLVALRRRQVARVAIEGFDRLQAATRAAPAPAAIAIVLLVAAGLPAWLPTIMYDDVAYHLGLPSQLQRFGYYRMDAGSQVWALAPWLGDSLHGVAAVLAGGDVRGALNLGWLACAAALVHRATQALAPTLPAAAWTAVALLASLPVTAALMAGMQTELVGAVFALVALCLVLAHADAMPAQAPSRERIVAFGLAAAAMLAVKTSMLPVVVLLTAWFCWRMARQPQALRQLAWMPLLLVLGASSYAYAWVLAGNPVLPLANATFQSPFFPGHNFTNPRFDIDIGVAVLWGMLFDSSTYYESWDGATGFHWLLLAIPALIAAAGSRTATALLLLAIGAAALQLGVQAYVRYLYPAMLLLLPLYGVGAAGLGRRGCTAVLVVVAVLAVGYQANAHWVLRDGNVFDVARAGGDRSRVRDRAVPEHALMERVLDAQPDAAFVLLSRDRPYAASFSGSAFVTNWYDTRLSELFAEGGTAGTQRALSAHRFTHALVPAEGEPAREALVALPGAERLEALHGVELWRLPPPSQAATDLRLTRDAARRHVHALVPGLD